MGLWQSIERGYLFTCRVQLPLFLVEWYYFMMVFALRNSSLALDLISLASFQPSLTHFAADSIDVVTINLTKAEIAYNSSGSD